MNPIKEFQNVALKDTSFANLMQKRVYNVLLIATKYDLFMLEDDGRVDEQIFNEYMSLSLRYPPRFSHVTTEDEALALLEDQAFQLIIFIPNMVDRDIFGTPNEIKRRYPHIPIVVLTPFSKEVSKCIEKQDLSAIDYVFSWLGNAELLMAIIKLVEDKMNAPDDTKSVGVQIILFVEDSIRFYSAILPHLYRFVLQQSMEFAKEALNEHQKMLRMRGRPKIKLARSYEEAMRIYHDYNGNILGIITDVTFNINRIKDPLAGYHFCRQIREEGNTSPIIMQSSNMENEKTAQELNVPFLFKHSKTYPRELKKRVMEDFGFGDFVIINPETKEEIMRITDLIDLQNKLFKIPDDSLRYHFEHNHFSRFLYSRAIFPPAERMRPLTVAAFNNINEVKQFIYDTIVEYRKMKNSGVVAIYRKDRFDKFSTFARIGEGSLGGKGRGLAFISAMTKQNPHFDFPNFPVNIPKTVVLCTDIFDEFMETNNLYAIALSDIEDNGILHHFLQANLPAQLIDNLIAFIDVVKSPIAIRSSSLLEDAHYQPFAGVYSTYMVPDFSDPDEMLHAVCQAIKGVYASVFYKDSKAYMTATRNVIESEKMAIVMQEVIGRKYGDHLYPTISGVAKSLNYYPIGHEKAEDGIASIALGLGKYVVDGGVCLRFSPRHPGNILQLSSLDMALRETQISFLALDMKDTPLVFDANDSFNLVKLSLRDADKDGILKFIVSTYDPEDMLLRDGYYPGGRKIISFANILKHNMLPLCETLNNLLETGQKEMGRPIEIEFAVDIKPDCNDEGAFYMLQIRPIVDRKELIEEDLSVIRSDETILFSNSVLGHGIINDVYDILYVKSESFNSTNNLLIASEIEAINRQFTEKEQGFVLVGPGRWGSNDRWLGIPVKWSQISNARAIAEYSLANYKIDPSQGTHFFQNLTSNGIGYFTVNPPKGDLFDENFLQSQPAAFETAFLRLIHFDHPIVIKMDGKKSIGLVMKPI